MAQSAGHSDRIKTLEAEVEAAEAEEREASIELEELDEGSPAWVAQCNLVTPLIGKLTAREKALDDAVAAGRHFDMAAMIREAVREVVQEEIRPIISAMEAVIALQHGRFQYNASKGSRASDPGIKKFSERVKKAYDALSNDGAECWCVVTAAFLPASTVIGAHLFKHDMKDDRQFISLDDINAVGNGLPLWEPIKWAFDDSRLCILYDGSTGDFQVHLIDSSIKDINLVDKGSELMGPQWLAPTAPHLATMVYSNLHGRPLSFRHPIQRPLKRFLCFQARSARAKAIMEKWITGSEWDFEDFYSEGMSAQEKMAIFWNVDD